MKTSALDVHKDTIFCAIYNGNYNAVKEFSTTTTSIRALGEYLQLEKVKKVAMESTVTYWVPVDVLLMSYLRHTDEILLPAEIS